MHTLSKLQTEQEELVAAVYPCLLSLMVIRSRCGIHNALCDCQLFYVVPNRVANLTVTLAVNASRMAVHIHWEVRYTCKDA